jgi:hypothetical protein
MASRLGFGAFLLLPAVLGGCGGGHSIPVIPISNTVRMMQAAEEWQYSVDGTVTMAAKTISVTGTWQVTVSPETVDVDVSTQTTHKTVTCTVLIDGGDIHGENYSFIVANRLYVLQSPKGTVNVYGGRNGTDYTITQPDTGCYPFMVSPMTVQTSWGGNVVQSNGFTFNVDVVLVAEETITVPNGTFQTFRATGNGIFGGRPAIMQVWYAPQIAAPVQLKVTCEDGSGNTLRVDLKLTSRTR